MYDYYTICIIFNLQLRLLNILRSKFNRDIGKQEPLIGLL